MTAPGASGEANGGRSVATAHVKGVGPADTRSPKVMSACGIQVTKNPAEMGKLLKSVLQYADRSPGLNEGREMRTAFGRIPELEYCAVRVWKGGEVAPLASYREGQAMADNPVWPETQGLRIALQALARASH